MGEAKKKVVMFPSKDPNTYAFLTCPDCGFNTFLEAWQIRVQPALISRTGKETNIPIGPMYMCLNRDCGRISNVSELIPKTKEPGEDVPA
jgi:hypothetical protein